MKVLNVRRYLYFALGVLSILGIAETVLVRGFLFSEAPSFAAITRTGYSVLIFLYLAWIAVGIFGTKWRLRLFLPDLVLAAVITGTWFPISFDGSIVSFRIVLALLIRFFRTEGIGELLRLIQLNPARLLLLTFLGGILAGTFLLMLPAATTDRGGADFIDALFTSTSAICVTGLAVKDTGTFYTGFGQVVILALIQVGGLGIITFSTLYTILLGRRLGWRQEAHVRDIMETQSVPKMYTLIVGIVTGTLLFEIVGSIILTIRFFPDMGLLPAARNAVFHCVSAFCNAGFSLFPDNLMRYTGDIWVNAVIAILITLGGIGFVVIDDIKSSMGGWNPFRIRWSRLTVHTRLVLITSFWITILGAMIIFFLEFDNSMLRLSSGDKFLASLFQSVTCRTAGFNTVDIGACRDATLFVMILLMFIGASPASCGGGVKTSTLAILVLAARAHLKSREKVEVYEKSIPPQTVFKAVAILLFSSSFIVLFTILLMMSTNGQLLPVLFESVSAIGTVGLSTGITPDLTPTGKLLITILMYVGRIGPLSMALAFGESRRVSMEYPSTRIIVG